MAIRTDLHFVVFGMLMRCSYVDLGNRVPDEGKSCTSVLGVPESCIHVARSFRLNFEESVRFQKSLHLEN